MRTWEDDAYVCLDETGQPVDDIAHTHHLIPSGLFEGSDVPDEWNIIAVRRVSSGMTQLQQLSSDHGEFDERRQLEVLTQLNAGAGIVIDEIDTTPPFTHVVQLGGEFYLAQMRSPIAAGMAHIAGDDSVLGDLAEAPAAPTAAASPPPASAAQPPVPQVTASAQTAPPAPSVDATPVDTRVAAPPGGGPSVSTAAQTAETGTKPSGSPVAEGAPTETEPSVAEEIARQVREATAKEAAAGDRPRRKRSRAATKPSLTAVAKADGDSGPGPQEGVTLAAVAKPEAVDHGAQARGATLEAVARPEAPSGGSENGAGLAAVAKSDDGPAGGSAADLLKAVASPLDASADSAKLEAKEPLAASAAGLTSALGDRDGDIPGGTGSGVAGARGASLVDELRPDGEEDPRRAASLAQADEFVSAAAAGMLEIGDDVLSLEQVRTADRFAWDELMNLYLPHIGFVATRVPRAPGRGGGKADVTYLPRPEVAMRPIGWHHLAGCDCEFCR